MAMNVRLACTLACVSFSWFRGASALSFAKDFPAINLQAASSSSEAADQVESGHKLVSFKMPCSLHNGTAGSGFWVILYQTSMSLAPLGGFLYSQLAEQMSGMMQPEVIGMGTHFGGFSSKHHLAVQRLTAMDPDDLVILSDYADVVLNPGRGRLGDAFCSFRDEYRRMVEGKSRDAVVISAEAQCCVGALSYTTPGSLIMRNNTRAVRKERACNSGAMGCLGLGRDTSWRSFMEHTAAQRGYNGTQYPYLNAGLMAGRAGALSKMLSDIQLDTQEDDQAVMTDMMVAFPERFVLDYDQQLFGNARWPKEKNGCVFKMDRTGFFQQTETGSHPLFLHTSGKFYRCLRSLAAQVGWTPPAGMQVEFRANSAATPANVLRAGALLAAATLLLA